MKKLFVSVLAIAAVVACNNAEVLDVPNGAPIQFENAFVQNATRAEVVSTTKETLEAFDVWAYIHDKSGTVLTDEDVKKGNGQWGYANLQYWAPGHMYYFTALAPMNSANWDYDQAADKVSFTNVDGSEDLLYAYKEVSTENLTIGGSMEAVKLTFNHLLSKVYFNFKNGFATGNVKVAVKSVKMTAVKSAEVTLNGETATWSGHTGDLTLEFGDAESVLASGAKADVATDRLTIPTPDNYTYNIEFDVDVYFGEYKGIADRKFTTSLTGVAFEVGKAYKLSATINPENLEMTPIEFEVDEVKDWIEQDINGGVIGDKIVVVDTLAELQAALDAATGNTSIAVVADLVGSVYVPELNGATISINGNGHKFDGTFFINGKSTYGQGTTIIENFAFETADNASFVGSKDAFIYCGEHEGTTLRYPDNVVVKDCTFKGTEATVGIKFWSLKGDLVVENCSTDGLHSLMQLTSCGTANVLVDGAVVENGKNGISLQYAGNTVIKNSTIKAREYGVRADGCVANTSIEKTTIEANQPIVVRKVTTAGYVLNVDEASVLNNTGLYQVIFTKNSDDAAYVAPAVDFTFNGPADLLVFPSVIVADNAETLAAALTANQNINVVLANDIDLPISSLGQQTGGSGEYKLGGENTETITIDLNGKKLNVTTTYWSGLGAKNADALFTIKNGTMTSSQASGTWNSYDLCFANCNYNFEDVVFEKAIALEGKAYNLKNVTIKESHDYYAMWITAKGQNVTIDGLTIESAGRGIKIDEQYQNSVAKVTLNVNNATFKTAKKAAIVVKSVEGAEINWGAGNSIAEVAADTNFAVWVDEDSAAVADKVVVNGAYSKVEGVAVIMISTAEELNNLSATNAYVVLTADIDFQGAAMTKPIQLWKDSTFDGLGHKISNVKTAVQGGYATSLFRGDANPGNKVVKNLVIENLTTPAGYSYASTIWSDLQGANIEIDNVHINNASISANGTVGGFVGFVSGSTTSVVIKNSSINNSNLNGGEADKKRGAVVGRAYGCAVTCDNVVVDNVKINDVVATTETLVGDKGYTGTVTVK